MADFKLEREVLIRRPREEIFEFFSDAFNLQVLTPGWLHFNILTPAPIEMRVGTRIDYRLRLFGVPLRWTSEITAWEPPLRFIDEQLSGPYKKWVHEHRFVETESGTLVTDEVDYAVPLGAPVNALIVGPQLKMIFDYRSKRMLEHFGEKT